jgi:hypothetical protein
MNATLSRAEFSCIQFSALSTVSPAITQVCIFRSKLMAIYAMSFTALKIILSIAGHSVASAIRIVGIVAMCTFVKVLNPNAQRIVAMMKNEHCGPFSVVKEPCNAVGLETPAESGYGNSSVPRAILRAFHRTRPLPAVSLWALAGGFVYHFPESFCEWMSWSSHKLDHSMISYTRTGNYNE